jgi:hypothetical protein
MSFWANLFKRRGKQSSKQPEFRDFRLRDGSIISAQAVIQVHSGWNNDDTRAIGYLKDKFAAFIEIYRQKNGTYTAQQSLDRAVIFISSDEIRQALESTPKAEEVRHFRDLDSAAQWILQGELIRSENVAKLFNEEFEKSGLGETNNDGA